MQPQIGLKHATKETLGQDGSVEVQNFLSVKWFGY